jgi:hypothetical protein
MSAVISARESDELNDDEEDLDTFWACSSDFSIFKFSICFLKNRMNDFRFLLSFFNARIFFIRVFFSFCCAFNKSHYSLYSLISSRFFSRIILIIFRSLSEEISIQNLNFFMISM